jgi:uncharacterized membrane protein
VGLSETAEEQPGPDRLARNHNRSAPSKWTPARIGGVSRGSALPAASARESPARCLTARHCRHPTRTDHRDTLSSAQGTSAVVHHTVLLSEDTVNRSAQAPLIFFSIGIISLGILALVFGDFAEVGQTVAAWVPGRTGLAYASGIVMLVGGIGLLPRRTTASSVRILLPFLIVGFLLQVPTLVMTPLVEVNWESAGEVAVLVGGMWVLFATRSGLVEGSRLAFATGDKGLRIARIIFGAALIPIGISHFAYLEHTVDLVPAWLPFRTGWAYLTGAGHIAAGLGVLFSVVPRLAAAMESGMLGVFTLVVWVPRIVAAPRSRDLWTEIVVSWAITAAAWLVADSFATKDRGRAD